MATSYQSHKSSPINWGLLRSCLGGSETSQGRDPQSHESDPIWGQLRVQGSQCCNRGLCQSHKISPINWGLLRSCLGGSETSQGHVPQGHWGLLMLLGSPCCNRWQHHHECSPNNWGLLMSQGSSCCNRWQHRLECGPNKWGLLRSCLGGFKTSQGREPHVSCSPQPRAELWMFLTSGRP